MSTLFCLDGNYFKFILIYIYEVFRLIIKSIHIKKNCISLIILIIFLSSNLVLYFNKKSLESIEVNTDSEGDYIKWVDFTVPCNVLKLTSEFSIFRCFYQVRFLSGCKDIEISPYFCHPFPAIPSLAFLFRHPGLLSPLRTMSSGRNDIKRWFCE